MLNNNFIGILIALLISVLFAFNLNKNNKKEPFSSAGGMPQRALKSEKIVAFVRDKDCGDPNKVQYYGVSNFQTNPSPRGVQPSVGPLLRSQLKNPARLSNDIRMKFDSSCKTAEVEDFVGMVGEGFDNNCKVNSNSSVLPTTQPDYSAGNYNEMKAQDLVLTDLLPVGDMRAVVDDDGEPGKMYQFERMMYANLKDRNTQNSDFIRGDIAIPQNKGTCWFGQRGHTLRPSALTLLGGEDLSNAKALEKLTNPLASYRTSISQHLSASSGDVQTVNETGNQIKNISAFF